MFGQSKDKLMVAKELLQAKQYSKAIPLYKELIKEHSSANLNYQLGLCYFNINKEVESIQYFEIAIKNITKKYKSGDLNEEKAPLSVFYYFAKSHHVNGNIILAFEFYNKFYSESKNKNPLKKKALAGIYQCEIADELLKIKNDFIIWNLGDTLNTLYSEYRPVISVDGSVIYFTSSRMRPDSTNKDFISPETGSYYEDIYASYRTKSGKWTEPNYLSFCRVSQNEASVSLSLDGNQIFVYQGGNGNGDIYYSDLNRISFESLKPFPAKSLNSNSQEPHATMGINGEFVYFVSDRTGGYGGKDIYRIRELPDGTWSKAMNLGPTINSEYDEESPFIGPDNRTLYFSSNGINSIGGYDVFVSQLNIINEWSTPKNLGYPLNSLGDDLYYSTMANGFLGIFASDNKSSVGDFDIYFVQTANSYYKNVAIFKGYISTVNETDFLPKGITIHVKDITENSDEIIFKPRLRDGGYILNLKPCHSYLIEYRFKGKVFHQDQSLVPCNSSYQEIHEEIILDIINLKV
ncbi:MAG: PD40 domain-containing protein, partial [Mycoplasmataceae bacterium]|nr:PD40 domain-containing protein [Mycoplasmataceae bacterium]